MGLTWRETLITMQADGPALVAAAAASCLNAQAKYPLPAQFFGVIGKAITIRAQGKVSTVITNPGTMRFDVRFGGTVVWDSLAIVLDTVAAHTNMGWWLEIDLTAQIVGAAAKLMGHGKITCENLAGTPTPSPKGSLTAMLPWNSAPAQGAAFDASVSQTVDLFYTQTLATGSLTCQQYRLMQDN